MNYIAPIGLSRVLPLAKVIVEDDHISGVHDALDVHGEQICDVRERLAQDVRVIFGALPLPASFSFSLLAGQAPQNQSSSGTASNAELDAEVQSAIKRHLS